MIFLEMVFRDDNVNNGDDNADSHDELNDDGRNRPIRQGNLQRLINMKDYDTKLYENVEDLMS